MDLLSALLFLGGIALLVGGLVAFVANRARPAVGKDKVVIGGSFPTGALLVAGVVALAGSVALSAFIQIPAGYVGVVRQFGAVTGATLDPVSIS